MSLPITFPLPTSAAALRPGSPVPVAASMVAGWAFTFVVTDRVDAKVLAEFGRGVKLRNLTREPRAAMAVDAMGPKRGVAMQGRVELIAPERARLTPVRKFSWGL